MRVAIVTTGVAGLLTMAGWGGWGFPSAAADVPCSRHAAWSDPALGGVQGRRAVGCEVLRSWPSCGASWRQDVPPSRAAAAHHGEWASAYWGRREGEAFPSSWITTIGRGRTPLSMGASICREPWSLCPARPLGPRIRKRDIFVWHTRRSIERHRQMDVRFENLGQNAFRPRRAFAQSASSRTRQRIRDLTLGHRNRRKEDGGIKG